jgi:hypothetical protein
MKERISMIQVNDSSAIQRCDGVSRRSFLRAGTLGVGAAGLNLSSLLRIRAEAASSGRSIPSDRSVILIWLDGGPPQHETYDPKPDAPVEFRGPLKAMETNVEGVRISELLPRHARIMDKVTLIRSLHHDNGDHFTGAHWMLTGYGGPNGNDTTPRNPSAGSIITKLLGSRKPGMPPYVGLPQTHSVGLIPGYHGGSYLGIAQNPFMANGDPNLDSYQVQNLTLPSGVDAPRVEGRRTLLAAFDKTRRDVDASGIMDGLDRFDRQAFELVLGSSARQAFDIRREDPRLRDRYGRHQWGQSALMARRLVESGVRFVTLTYGGWDYHSSLEVGMKRVLPVIDAAIATLIEDLSDRGLLESTAVIVMGEFGRTPRMNKTGVPGSDPVPGRDHWGNVMSVLVAGGGFPKGQVLGASNARGEVPKDRPIRPQDFLVTLYHQFGIPAESSFADFSGRPVSIGSNGQLIPELVS